MHLHFVFYVIDISAVLILNLFFMSRFLYGRFQSLGALFA